jgi:hypothetical protein
MERAGSQNAECRMEETRIQAFIPNSEIRIPNLPCRMGPLPSAEVERST